MNIIIPLAGNGQRFKDDGYRMPKPLINVLGEPIIFHVIRRIATPEDTILIVYHKSLDEHSFSQRVKREFPNTRFVFVPLEYPTRGPVETVLCGLNAVEAKGQDILVMDGDTFYSDTFIYGVRAKHLKNAVYTFQTSGEDPIYSYVKVDDYARISRIAEKEKISDIACSGAYRFRELEELKQYCQLVLKNEEKSKGEYYMSNVIAAMISADIPFEWAPCGDFTCLGTPNQVKAYCASNTKPEVPRRFCFDLDNTLCTFPSIPGDYTSVKPIEKNIERLRRLKERGHTIIISTARGMKSNAGNMGKIQAKVAGDVALFLLENDIPHDELYFGKPYADFYIDDLAVSTNEDIDKATGYYSDQVEPRSFNKVEFDGDSVTKTTNNPGEVYWYNNMPSHLRGMFPRNHVLPDGRIAMDRIKGVSLHYLWVNGSLTKTDIKLLADTAMVIHRSAVLGSKIDIYANYSKKLQERMASFDYNSVLNGGAKWGEVIRKKLDQYQAGNHGCLGIIHGDMVFSNIFLCEPRHLKFIDMRGKVGDKETIHGDIFYDYAKIYQSLCGYDHILVGRENTLTKYNEELLRYFEVCIRTLFGEEKMKWIRILTASLFYTLIPLHENEDKRKQYLSMAVSLI